MNEEKKLTEQARELDDDALDAVSGGAYYNNATARLRTELTTSKSILTGSKNSPTGVNNYLMSNNNDAKE